MKKSAKRASELAAYGVQALQAGHLETATKALRVAAADLPRDGDVRYQLGVALHRQGSTGDAIVTLTEALARRPTAVVAAAGLLSALLKRYTIGDAGELDPAGLVAALKCDGVDQQPIVRTSLAVFRSSSVFRDLPVVAAASGWDEAARAMITGSSPLVRDELLREALSRGFNTDPEIEKLLVAVRRSILCDVSEADLLARKELFGFAVALAAQAEMNQHIWPVEAEEAAALDALGVDPARLERGDVEAGAQLVKLLLYRPAVAVLPHGWTEAEPSRVRPKSLTQLLVPLVSAWVDERARAGGISAIGEIADATSQAVAMQYERTPYPRWTSLNVDASAIRLAEIERLAGEDAADRLRSEPFDVLVAGCGTGHHAAQATVAYGPTARLVGLDLSRASLAYAERMCAAFGLSTIRFVQGDLLDIDKLGQSFDVIECVGVLHHMAAPFMGWTRLVDVLRPGGVMHVGLYSAVARQEIAALRAEQGFPGPGCSNAEARRYRAELMGRPAGAIGHGLIASDDFYTLSDFRDLVLHPSEQHHTLDEIGAFLDEAGLAFLGFALDADTMARYRRAYPDDPPAGTLAHWAAFEAEHPRTFDGMYCLWCRKAEA